MNIFHVPGGSLCTLDTSPSLLSTTIPGTGEPGWLPSMGLHRVRHDWSDLAAAAQSSEVDLIWFSHRCQNRDVELYANNHRVGRSEVPTQHLLTPKLILFSLLTYIALPMTLIIFCLIFQVSHYESFGSKHLNLSFLSLKCLNTAGKSSLPLVSRSNLVLCSEYQRLCGVFFFLSWKIILDL